MTGSWVAAVVLSSALFAAPHAVMQAAAIIIPLFFIAVLWCVVTMWRRSLVPAVVAHFVLNLVNLLFIADSAPASQ